MEKNDKKQPNKASWLLFVIFILMVLAIVIIGTRFTCPDIESEIKDAMLRSETQQVGIFKIQKTEDGKNLISLGE